MSRYHLEEDAQHNILICDSHGQEVARFGGQDALAQALDWANERHYTLWANVSPIDLLDNQRLYFRRRPRFLHLHRYLYRPQNQPQDPPNIKRIYIPEQEWFEDEHHHEEEEAITLAPNGADEFDDI